MPSTSTTKRPDKRKHVVEEDVQPNELPTQGHLEMLTDEEDEDALSSDDGQVDEFPEIVAESDSDDQSSGEEEVEDEEEEDTDSDSDSLHIFPKAKTVVSSITKQPKLVYPDIYPDYDSDSSTEEVNLGYTKLDYIKILSSRHRTELAMFLCTGMTIYHTLGTI